MASSRCFPRRGTMFPAVAAAIAVVSQPALSQQPPIITVTGGAIAGSEADEVQSWKGIPFARPPVGELRWRAPQPVEAWTGVRDATRYGSDCMQKPNPSDAAPLGSPPSEDCLFLNVWRPAKATGKLPVMVWIYGGGFVNGGSSAPTYSGAQLAKKGVLVVSFNYRLGRFGFFGLPQLSHENADGGLLGNYAVLDQIEALRWVQNNISSFGGDPKNVTIVGESAGGVSVHLLATSHLTEGLFQRGVIMSGADGGRTGTATLQDIERIGGVFARQNGIDPEAPDALSRLRALSAEKITGSLNLAATFTQSPVTWVGPFVDGTIVTDMGDAYSRGTFRHVPMMIGATSGDLDGTTGFMIAGARPISAKLAAQGLPIYQYRFSYVASSSTAKQAPHATDIPFFFNTVEARYKDHTTAVDRQAAETMSDHLVRFVKSGDPNGGSNPYWPRQGTSAESLMVFGLDGKAGVMADPLAQEIEDAPPPAYPDFIKGTAQGHRANH